MNEKPEGWLDLLSEPTVEYIARKWGKSPDETWGFLSRAIKNEEASRYMPPIEFNLYVKFVIDPKFFETCPACHSSVKVSYSYCPTCHVDLDTLRNTIIGKEFSAHHPTPKVTAPISGRLEELIPPTPLPAPPQKTSRPSPFAKLLLSLSMITYIVGGILAMLYSLYVVAFLFGWVIAIVALFIFPVTYFLLPFYTLFTYGDLSLLIANYGVGILAFLLSFIAHLIDPNLE